MLKIKWYKAAGAILLTFVFLMGTNLYGQSGTLAPKSNSTDNQNDVSKQNAKKWTDQLNQKLSLTEEQETRIEGILVDYQQSSNTATADIAKLQSTYNSRIESVLNENQKKIFESYEAEWWKGMSTTTTKESTGSY